MSLPSWMVLVVLAGGTFFHTLQQTVANAFSIFYRFFCLTLWWTQPNRNRTWRLQRGTTVAARSDWTRFTVGLRWSTNWGNWGETPWKFVDCFSICTCRVAGLPDDSGIWPLYRLCVAIFLPLFWFFFLAKVEIVDIHFGTGSGCTVVDLDPYVLDDHLYEIETCHRVSKSVFLIVSILEVG